MEQFSNRVVLITGSSAGIGASIAEHMAGCGARLSLTGRDESKLTAVKSKCVKAGLKPQDILLQVGDLTDDAFRTPLITNTLQTFGQLDVLVNNAGVAKGGLLSDPGMEDFNDLISLNLHSPVALTKLAIPHLKKTKGNIINISTSLTSRPLVGMGAYNMTKTALDMFTQVLALELAPCGVRVNSVNAGFIKSEIYRGMGMDASQYSELLKERARTTPIGRVGKPEDIARAVAFLASDKSSFITGELMVVDGGGRYGMI